VAPVTLKNPITATFELERPHLPEYWMAYRTEGKYSDRDPSSQPPTNPLTAIASHTGSTKIEGKKRIHFGQIYSLTAKGVEVTTPPQTDTWVPRTGFGFRNHRTAAPIILVARHTDEHCGHTPPDSAAINPDQPLWVPGVGKLEPHPPCKRSIAVWFQSEFNAPTLRTGDQSVFWQIEWSDYGDSRHLSCYYSPAGAFTNSAHHHHQHPEPKSEPQPQPQPNKGVQPPQPHVDGVNLAKPPTNKPHNFSQGGFPDFEFQNKGFQPPSNTSTTAAAPTTVPESTPQNTGFQPPPQPEAPSSAQNGFPPLPQETDSQNTGFDPTSQSQSQVARAVSQYEGGKGGVGADEEDASNGSGIGGQAKLLALNGDALGTGMGTETLASSYQGQPTMKVTMMNGFY
jgi:hypothetical protein